MSRCAFVSWMSHCAFVFKESSTSVSFSATDSIMQVIILDTFDPCDFLDEMMYSMHELQQDDVLSA